jgi:hypothetical protein
MTDQPATPNPPSAPDVSKSPAPAPEPPYNFNIGEEFGTAKAKLPPTRILLIGVAIVLVVAGIIALVGRAKPQGSGQIDHISVVEVPSQGMVLVAATLTLRNTGEKTMYVRSIKGTLKTGSDQFDDPEPVSAVDFERYFQAFPVLKDQSQSALLPEAKLATGEERRGTVIFSFPVSMDKFNQRTSFAVSILPYDQTVPVVMESKR